MARGLMLGAGVAGMGLLALVPVKAARPVVGVNEPALINPANINPAVKGAAAAGSAAAGSAVKGENELQLLQNAFVALARADQEYKGHRDKAMGQIEAACILLGGAANRPAKSKQAFDSDTQVRTAQADLIAALPMATGDKQKSVETEINKAIGELNTALSSK